MADSGDPIPVRINEARAILGALNFGARSPWDDYILLGLASLPPDRPWNEAQAPRVSFDGILGFTAEVYQAELAPDSREALRERLSILVQHDLARLRRGGESSPDESSDSIYQIHPRVLKAIRKFGTSQWPEALAEYRRAKDSPPDAFMLYNEREPRIDEIVDELEKQGIKTYYWHNDLGVGKNWRAFEAAHLREAATVVVFLGNSGWGENHSRLAVEAQENRKAIIPVLLGDPPAGEIEKARGIFLDLAYLEIKTRSEAEIDRLVVAIRRGAASPVVQEFVPRSLEVDSIIRTLTDGNEEQRFEVLCKVQHFSPGQSAPLAQRLRAEIEGPFSAEREKDFATSARDPKKLSSIRSWMLSCLIWADAEEARCRACILNHLSPDYEPDRSVRFWALAGLYQRQVTYLDEVVKICSSDGSPEVAALARCVPAPTAALYQEFRSALGQTDFEGPWSVLRALRIRAIPELVADICSVIDETRGGTRLTYDAFYALAHPEIREAAAAILTRSPGIDGVVDRILREVAESNENAAWSFAKILASLEPSEVDPSLRLGSGDQKLKAAAEMVERILKEVRRKASERIHQSTYSSFVPDRAAYGAQSYNGPLDDSLKVGSYAGHLAQLIAAKDTLMPLSIGLFGPWGSGKSHFIDLLDQQLEAITKSPGTAFHRDIVPIRFNAWHYLDTSLWANLVCEIFDQLFAKLSDKGTAGKQIEKLKEKLTEQSALAAEAKSALELAEKARKQAEDQLNVLAKERREKEEKVGGLLDNLQNLLKNSTDIKDALGDVAGKLGLPEIKNSFADLEARALEARTLGGRFKAISVAVLGEACWWKNVLLVAVMLAVPLVPWLLSKLDVESLSAAIAQIVAAMAALATWLGSHVSAGSRSWANSRRPTMT